MVLWKGGRLKSETVFITALGRSPPPKLEAPGTEVGREEDDDRDVVVWLQAVRQDMSARAAAAVSVSVGEVSFWEVVMC